MKNRNAMLLSTILTATMLSGCGQSGGDTATPAPEVNSDTKVVKEVTIPTDPITLKMYRLSNVSEEINQVQYLDVIKKKYPFITIENINNGKGTTLPDLIAADNVPDIIIGGNPKDVLLLKSLNLTHDMSPLIKKFNFDISRVEPAALEMVKKFTGDESIYGIPESVNYVALYYNKDIFDKFSVPYPKDGMTWADLTEVAKKVSRMDKDIKYRGFDFQYSSMIQTNPLSLPLVDKSDKAAVNTPEWKNFFETLKGIYAVQGNEASEQTIGKESNSFLSDKTLAMITSTTFFSKLPDAVASGLNFDLVTVPTFPQAPKTGIQATGPFLSVTSTSKYKDQAFAVIAQLLSDEGQMSRSVNGRAAAVVTPELKQRYGENLPYLKGKNISAFTLNKIAPAPANISQFDQIAYTALIAKFKDFVLGKVDVNTALRDAEELINKNIAAEKTK